MADNRPPAYIDGDKIIYRASAVGGCSAALWLARQGIPPEAPNQTLAKAFDQGNTGEDVVISMMESDGWEVMDRQKELEIHLFDNVYVRCHPDGVAIRPDEYEYDQAHVLEVKSFAESTMKKWQSGGWNAFPYYAAQVTCEMAGTGYPCLFVVGEKDKDGVVVKYTPTIVSLPPMTWAAIVLKIRAVEAAVTAAEMPGCDVANDWGCMYWPYHEEKDKVEAAPAANPQQLDWHVSQLVALKGQIAELEQRKKEVEKYLKERQGQQGDKWVNAWVSYTKKGAINYNSMKEDGIDVEQYRKADVEVSYPQPKALD